MKIKIILPVVLVATVAAVVGFGGFLSASGGRAVTSNWMVDPLCGATKAHITATTSSGADFSTQITVADPLIVVIRDTTSEQEYVIAPAAEHTLEAEVNSYPSGTPFTVTAKFFDATGNLNDTQSIIIIKP